MITVEQLCNLYNDPLYPVRIISQRENKVVLDKLAFDAIRSEYRNKPVFSFDFKRNKDLLIIIIDPVF